ncbi:MAG: hypothetical protein L0312_32160, partial [Acidobacteria bacterium]|nr:hypothetical protein [Acidobacteriota bacterium]
MGAEGSQGTALGSKEKQPTPAEEARLEVLGAAASAVEKPQDGVAGKGEPGERAGTETGQLVAEESQAVAQDENAHLRQRLKESESLVELMRRQVQLKDDELAELQAKLAQAGTAVPQAGQKLAGEAIEKQPEATDAGAETAARPSEPQETAVSVLDSTAVTKPLAEAGPAAAPSGEETQAEAASPSQPAEATPSAAVPTEPSLPEPGGEAQAAAEPTGEAGVPPPVVDSQETASTSAVQGPEASAEPSDGLADTAPPAGETQQEGAAVADPVPVEDTLLIPGGIYSAIGLIAVAGLFVFWVFWRMRAKSQRANDEDELTVEVSSQTARVSGFAGTRQGEDEEAPVVERTLEDLQEHDVEADMEEGERTRFSTELAAEKDPLEEVNLCIAYERFNEAEQLVKKAIAEQPGRHDYKLRLLEVYYAAGNKGGYERAARELNAAVGGHGPLWDNAIAMWYEISPERPLFAEQSGEDDRRRDDMDAQHEVLDITSVSGGEPWKSESSPERAGLKMASALDFDLGTTQEKEVATPISARGGSEQVGEYTDVFDLSSPEDAASEGIVDVTMVEEEHSDAGQTFDPTMAETTSGAEDVFDLTAADAQRGVDQEMLDLTVADNAANADEMLDLTTAGSDYQDDGLDFDITGGHELPETTEESDDALHLTVPKASFPSAKAPEPQEQVFEFTHPTERSGSGAANSSLEIAQETVELPHRNISSGADAPDDAGIQTVDLFHYFNKGADDASQPDAA